MHPFDQPSPFPAEPGTETKQRYERGRDTASGSEELEIIPATWKPGDVVAGFEIGALIGSGLTSSVYRAREIETDRFYALKILRSRCDRVRATSRLGFRRMLAIKHPSLVYVDRVFAIDDYIAFTMELVTGKRLLDVINQHRDASRSAVFDLAYRVLHEVGNALQAMHAANLVHRDVKPENIMIDENGCCRLIDYGLVGEFDPTSDPDCRRNYLVGTYYYMAPESITKQQYPPACDIYALGTVILVLIADRSKLPQEKLGLSLGQTIGDVRSFLPPDTPADLADLLCDMLDPEVEDRPTASRLARVNCPESASLSGLRTVRREQLVGRLSEMAIAERWVQSVVNGKPTRLHISGDSGAGKSGFTHELLRRIRNNPWFQVFDSSCHARADVPMQAFDAISDAIARRYTREDRGPIWLPGRIAFLLRNAFPVLRPVVPMPELLPGELAELLEVADSVGDQMHMEREILHRLDLEKADSLAAGVALTKALCEYGPLFVVIDDIQWADADTIGVLEQLLQQVDANIGIITIGRTGLDPFRRPADCEIELKPLDEKTSIALLRAMLGGTAAAWTDAALMQLATLSEGNAYRLTQFAASILLDRDFDWHQRLLQGPIQAEVLWEHRLAKLSDHARVVLETLAVAGGRTRMRDLARASGLQSKCFDAIKELTHLQLVVDEAPRLDAIDVIHARLAECILKSIDAQRKTQLHLAWAHYLTTCEHDTWRASRIAGHLIQAGCGQEAVPYIHQAIADAEARIAFSETARWHLKLAAILEPQAAFPHLFKALTRFEDAGQPQEAAAVCQQLWQHWKTELSDSQRIDVLRRWVRSQFQAGNPNAALTTCELLTQEIDDWLQRCRDERNDAPEQEIVRVWDVLRRCHALLRPLLSFAPGFAFAFGRRLKRWSAQPGKVVEDQATSVHMDSLKLLPCRRAGSARRLSTVYFERQRDACLQHDDRQHAVCFETLLAQRHVLAGDWASAAQRATLAMPTLLQQRDGVDNEDAFLMTAIHPAFFWLGRLAELQRLSEQIQRVSVDRNDQCVDYLMSTGFGCVVPLLNDNVALAQDQRKRWRNRTRRIADPWLTWSQRISPVMTYLYLGKPFHALRYLNRSQSLAQTQALQRVELLDMVQAQWRALALLRIALGYPMERTAAIDQLLCLCIELSEKRSPFARMISYLYLGQANELLGHRQHCLDLYVAAADSADSLDLIPLRLAALDRISGVKGDSIAMELKKFLIAEGVKAPDRFARLYCGLCS